MMSSGTGGSGVVSASRRPSAALNFIRAAGVCTFFGLSGTAQHIVMLRRDGTRFLWERIAVFHLADWWLVALFTPVLFWMVRRWPIGPCAWRRNAALQFTLALPLVPLKFWLGLPILRLVWPQGQFSLEQQLEPHFLFNTLHAISLLMHRDPEAANTMLAELGEPAHLLGERSAAGVWLAGVGMAAVGQPRSGILLAAEQPSAASRNAAASVGVERVLWLPG